MYGETPACMLFVFSNARDGADDALARWYREVHGPDALNNGTFSALHRYVAAGEYPARFLALWEGSFSSLEEARARITPKAGGLRQQGRITSDLEVVWSSLEFLGFSGTPGGTEVGTLTVVEGGAVPLVDSPTSRYGGTFLYEQADAPAEVTARWSGRGQEGMAPHGPYRNIFDHPQTWPPPSESPGGAWVSHWRPLSSLRRADLSNVGPPIHQVEEP
jgi:hypothetical protein